VKLCAYENTEGKYFWRKTWRNPGDFGEIVVEAPKNQHRADTVYNNFVDISNVDCLVVNELNNFSKKKVLGMVSKKNDPNVQQAFKRILGNADIESKIEAGEIDEAEAQIDEIISTVKEQQLKLGQCYFQQGKIKELKLKYKEAYEAFKQAVNCQPDNAEYLNNAGLIGYKLADYEQAQQFFNKLLELTTSKFGENHPDTATSYINLSVILDAQGKHDEAESFYHKGLDIMESNKNAKTTRSLETLIPK
jgi:tetratricopeptide (TPR) repeat protein